MALKNWTITDISATTVTDLVDCGSGNACAIVGIVITNYNVAPAPASVNLTVTNSGDTTTARILDVMLIAAGDSYFIDTKIFVESTEKIRAYSTVNNVSFLASGDESTA